LSFRVRQIWEGSLSARGSLLCASYDEEQHQLSWREDLERKQKAQSLDGSYLLKSSRDDLSAEDIWRTYILLSRVEAAFRAIKSPLYE
jgi:hypothetical protein